MVLNVWTFIDYSDNFVNVTKNFRRNHLQVVGVNGVHVHGPLPASGMEALVEARLRPPPPPMPPSSAATRMLTFGMDRLLSSSKSSKEDGEEEELEEEDEENEGAEDEAEGKSWCK